jgi:Holliday junction resolvase-like predicted endonuclease
MRQQDIPVRLGELAAAEYGERTGLRVPHRNYRCAGGGIDIAAADRQPLARGLTFVVGVLRSSSGDFTIEPLRGVG